jgi:hypothetical protein
MSSEAETVWQDAKVLGLARTGPSSSLGMSGYEVISNHVSL